jgi:hypothetical protein
MLHSFFQGFVEYVLGPLLGYCLAAFVRWAKRYRFWRRVEVSAKAYLEDDRIPISDPREATEHALIEAQREVRASIPPPLIPSPVAPDVPPGAPDIGKDPIP